MYSIPEEEEDFLIEEKHWGLKNIKSLQSELEILDIRRNALLGKINFFRRMYEEADRKLAMANKLEVVKIGKRDSSLKALEKVLSDKKKAQKLIDLLKKEVGV